MTLARCQNAMARLQIRGIVVTQLDHVVPEGYPLDMNKLGTIRGIADAADRFPNRSLFVPYDGPAVLLADTTSPYSVP